MSEITVPVDEGAFGVFVVGSDIPVGSYMDSVPEEVFSSFFDRIDRSVNLSINLD